MAKTENSALFDSPLEIFFVIAYFDGLFAPKSYALNC